MGTDLRIAIRTDASARIGIGHLMRCFTLVDELRKQGAHTRFVCRSLPSELQSFLASHDHELRMLPPPSESWQGDELSHSHFLEASQTQDAAATRTALMDMDWDWLVVDHYALDHRWESELSEIAKSVMVIDDLADRVHSCNILLDQNYYSNSSSRYLGMVPKECKLLLGPRYALLREEFRQSVRTRPVLDTDNINILVFMGGSDPDNLTLVALEGLAQVVGFNLRITVVVGASNPNKDPIQEQCKSTNNVRFFCQTNNMAQLMSHADLCIGTGGSTIWERCAMGLPSIVVVVADNQIQASKDVASAGAIVLAGFAHEVTAEVISSLTTELLSDPERLEQMSDASKHLMGGEGNGSEIIASYLKDQCLPASTVAC